jgi:hypothetical protein
MATDLHNCFIWMSKSDLHQRDLQTDPEEYNNGQTFLNPAVGHRQPSHVQSTSFSWTAFIIGVEYKNVKQIIFESMSFESVRETPPAARLDHAFMKPKHLFAHCWKT